MSVQTFAALGDPTRAAIVDRLSRGPATVTEIAVPFEMSLRGVLKHVEVLEAAGVVHTVKAGRARQCVLRPDRIDEAARWINHVTERWERRMDRMDAYLRDKEGPRK